MNYERIYKQWEKKTLARGRAKGRAEGWAEGIAEGEAEGKLKGTAEAVLIVLESHGLAVTPAQREHVLACTDAAVLDAWLGAAVTTSSVTALLAGTATPQGPEKRGRSAA